MTADLTRCPVCGKRYTADVSTDTGALRSELIGALPGAYPWHEVVDRLLALPALRDLIAERDQAVAAVGRVRELVDGGRGLSPYHIRRALDGPT